MDPISSKTALAAAGAAGGEPLYVDDVFSTYLYEGTGSTLSIDNGIDLAGEGGLVWFKNRGAAWEPILFDTERGVQKYLQSNNVAGQVDRIASGDNDTLSSFNNNGFTVETLGTVNSNGGDYVSWTFRKAPGFFDVVTYTGDGTSSRNIAHNLGSVPGMIIVKRLNDSDNWQVYHRGLSAASQYLNLNTNSAAATSGARWNNTAPTSSVFTVGSQNNGSGTTFVAYLFAHDDQSFGTNGNESIIKCGSYTGNGTVNNATTEQPGPEINLGWEPQFVLIKNTSATDNWWIFDTMRGFVVDGNGTQSYLYANTSAVEGTIGGTYQFLKLTSTGFKITAGTGAYFNESGNNYVYMAIRRPHKPVEAGTEVYETLLFTGNSSDRTISTSIASDSVIAHRRSGGNEHFWFDRARGSSYYMRTSGSGAEANQSNSIYTLGNNFIDMGGGPTVNDSGVSGMCLHTFRRAPGFFDVVAYTGTGVAGTSVSHNLGVQPELIIVKNRTNTYSWRVLVTSGNKFLALDRTWPSNSNDARYYFGDNSVYLAPTSSLFYVSSGNDVNLNSVPYISYLFASCPGVSKVGSYTGTGTTLSIDCGFSAGARFVMIKRTDPENGGYSTVAGDWYVWDAARGIVSGNDPYSILNGTLDEVTNTDYIDPLNAGFTVTSSAPAALNASGGTYIFLAIA